MSACQGCGAAIASNYGPGRKRKWCSEACRKRTLYGGICTLCRAPTNGSNGPGTAASVCASCLRWDDEQIIAAIRAWAGAHGGIPPTCQDWRHAGAGHPAATTVRRMGWNEALLRAGFALRRDRRPETQAWIEREIARGATTREVAARLGVTPQNISNRLRYHGLSVRALRGAEPPDRRAARFCAMWRDGASVEEIAEAFGMARSSVVNGATVLRKRGHDLPLRRRNQRAKVLA